MTRWYRSVARAVLILAPTLSPAFAAPATPEQVTAVERTLNDWFRGLAGGVLTPQAYSVRPDSRGDTYTVTASLAPGITIMGHLSPQGDGRWQILDLKIPSPSTFTFGTAGPGPNGQLTAKTNRSVAFSAARQETSGTLDPTYATPSTVEQRFDSYQLGTTSADVLLLAQIEHVVNQITLNPAAGERVDVAGESSLDHLAVDQRRAGDSALHVTADRAHATSLLSNLSRDRGPAFFRALTAFSAERIGKRPLDATKPRTPFDTQQRAQVRAMLDMLQGLASAAKLDLEMTSVRIQDGGSRPSGAGLPIDATLGRLHTGGEVASTDGILSAHLDISADKLSIAQFKANAYADLVPKHLHLSPSLTGIGTQGLIAYLQQILDAADREHAPLPSPAPLFSRGDVTAGIDSLSLDAGPAAFDGHGTVTVMASGTLSGSGQVTATGLDALIDHVKPDPALQVALAALTIAKGLGRSDGDRTVWDIVYRDGSAFVNGVDVSALTGAAGLGRRTQASPQGTPRQ